jgi:LacI family transcriptional regulator
MRSRPRTPGHPRNVALLIEVSNAHARGLIRGVGAYAQEHGPWKLHLLESLRPADVALRLKAQPCDGVIARVETRALARVLAGCRRPVVNVAGTHVTGRWPRVDTDNIAVCALAAEHLIERSYRSFGFCGMPTYEWSCWRQAGFEHELTQHGYSATSLDLPSLTVERPLAPADSKKLSEWLRGLSKPAGILACNDRCGRAVLDACDRSGLAVPDEVGVIGVDNDQLVCDLCWPPLSSIEVNCERIGYVAAQSLDRLLRGERPEAREILIKPTTLVARRSSEATAVREPSVAEAVRFIRAYACKGIRVPDVARHVSVSRRYLEGQFRKALNRSVHTEIQRVRLETAQRLLGETDWKLQTIAERSGFKEAAHLSALFQKKLGLRPGQYRLRVQH